MKKIKIIYWATTVLLALMMSYSAYAYLTQEEIKQGFYHLGFPDYFRVELALAKCLGAIMLLVPMARRVKEWAYAGFAITFISAFIAHTAVGDPIAIRLGPLFFFVLLTVSYGTFHQLQKRLKKPSVITASGELITA